MPEPTPSEVLLGRSRADLRPDLRLLCGIYDQLAALNARLANASKPEAPNTSNAAPNITAVPPNTSKPRRARKDTP